MVVTPVWSCVSTFLRVLERRIVRPIGPWSTAPRRRLIAGEAEIDGKGLPSEKRCAWALIKPGNTSCPVRSVMGIPSGSCSALITSTMVVPPHVPHWKFYGWGSKG